MSAQLGQMSGTAVIAMSVTYTQPIFHGDIAAYHSCFTSPQLKLKSCWNGLAGGCVGSRRVSVRVGVGLLALPRGFHS